MRNLELTDNKVVHTIDTPTNTEYSDAEGTQSKGPWILTFENNMLPNGLAHPFVPPARTYCFSSGDACLTTSDVCEGQGIIQEIFFVRDAARASVTLFYPSGKNLSWLQLIREDKQGWPSPIWTSDVTSLSTHLPGDWPSADIKRAGREKIMTGIYMCAWYNISSTDYHNIM